MDMLQGFESTWRDAVRYLVAQAGVDSWLWLLLDAFLSEEQMRLRIGALLGAAVVVQHNSIGQGKRSGTHLFGTFVSAIIRMTNLATSESWPLSNIIA